MNYKKLFSAILCANFLINSTYMPVVFASEATYKQVVVNENYDPFADEETTKEPENLTMKQRVAKIMEEEKELQEKLKVVRSKKEEEDNRNLAALG